MDSDGNHLDPSADTPARTEPRGRFHVVDGDRSGGGRGHRTGRIEAVDREVAARSPWLRGEEEYGPWSRDEVRVALSDFHASPAGRYLTMEQRIVLADLLLCDRNGLGHQQRGFDGYCGLWFPQHALRPDLPGRLADTRIAFLRQLPVALRAWIRHCHHHERWPDGDMTVAVLDAVDQCEPAWHDAVDHEEQLRRSLRPFHLSQLAERAADVGGEAELWTLDTAPLPDEPLQLEGLDPDTALILVQVAERCDAYFFMPFMTELRTVSRRVLTRLGRDAPAALRRPSIGSIAGGVCYAAVHANVVGTRGTWYSTEHIAQTVATSPSGIPSRARSLLGALGIEQPDVDRTLPSKYRRRLLRVGSAELLTSSRRRVLAEDAAYLGDRLADTGF